MSDFSWDYVTCLVVVAYQVTLSGILGVVGKRLLLATSREAVFAIYD